MPQLNEPLRIKNLPLRNRLVVPPMVSGLATNGIPGKSMLDWYTQLATSGAALVIVEAASIVSNSQILPRQLELHADTPLGPIAALAGTIQSRGVPAVLQLVHGGARAWRADLTIERVAPSNVKIAAGPDPRALTEDEIEHLVAEFTRAALRAQAAGFAGVEVHAAHYYLISQFLSPFTNERSEAWGGSVGNRARFAVEIVRAIRQAVGADYPIFIRINAEERFKQGVSTNDVIETAKLLEAAGADVLDASGIGQTTTGTWEGKSFVNLMSALPRSAPAGAFAPIAGRLKAALRIPVITVGKLGESGQAQRVLDASQADLVAIARQVIADPQTPRKILEGRDGSIVRCKECMSCFTSIRQGALQCSVRGKLPSDIGDGRSTVCSAERVQRCVTVKYPRRP